MMARALLLFTLALWLPMAPVCASESVLYLDRADFVLSDAVLPPPADAPWSPQVMPDLWSLSRPGTAQTSGWYRLRFEVAQRYFPGQAHRDSSHMGRDLPRHKLKSAARRFVIE